MPLVGLVRPVRTMGGLDCHGAMHSGLGPRLFKYQQPDAAGVFGILGWGPGIGLSGVRTSYPCCSYYDEHNELHDDYYPYVHYHHVVFNDHQHVHHDDLHDAPVATRSHTVSERDSSEWIWMSCESSSPAVLQVWGVADVYLSLGWGPSDGDCASVCDDHNHQDHYHSTRAYDDGCSFGVLERVVVGPGAGVAGFNR